MSASFARLAVLFVSVLAVASPAVAVPEMSSGLHLRHYGPGSGQQTPACPPGSYSVNGHAPCAKCPPGYYQSNFGATNCVAAPPGWHAPGEGCSGPSKCPPGHFTGIHGSPECCQCPAGWYSIFEGSSSCESCPPQGGHERGYCSPGSNSPGSCKAQPGAMGSAFHHSDGTCPITSGPTPSAWKRNIPLVKQCRSGWKSCPVYTGIGSAAVLSTYECVDVTNDLESCGGCVNAANPLEASLDGGRDCSAIPNVDAVSCANGACIIEACAAGFALSDDGKNCVAANSTAHRRRKQIRDHAL